MKAKRFFLSALLLLAGISAAAQMEDPAVRIDSYIRKVQKEWAIPGLSVTVLKDGKTVLSKGYGVKMLGGEDPVDSATVFQIGSASKAFTSALMAMLVDEGKVRWDDRVCDLLPDWNPADKWQKEEMRVQDLMCHKTGYGSQAFTDCPNIGYDTDDVYEMMQLQKPEHPLRQGLHYNNMVFIIAQKIIEAKTGKSYEENLSERIFRPLGMTSGCYGKNGFLAAENRAEQHDVYQKDNAPRSVLLKGENRALHWLTVVGPAGGVCCSTEDLAKWAEFHRLEGLCPTGRLISKRQMEWLHHGQAILEVSQEKIRAYGQSWYIEQNRDYKAIYHTGTVWGHTALCFIVPDYGLSIAILVGSEVNQNARFAIARRITDIYRGAPDRDYSAEGLQKWLHRSGGSSAKSGFTIRYSKVAHTPQALCGTYFKEEPFGNAKVTLENGKLYLTHGKYGWKHILKHQKDNMYSFSSDGHRFPVRFRILPNGKADAFEINWGNGEEFGPWTKTK